MAQYYNNHAKGNFHIDRQPVMIYDGQTWVYRVYSGGKTAGKKSKVKRSVCFDGVAKLQHKMSLTVQADPKNAKGAKYVNGAINNQNEVTMDVYMSNVYCDNNIVYSVTGKDKKDTAINVDYAKSGLKQSGDRAGDVFSYLNELKTSRRTVWLITPYVTYKDMLLSEINIVQDDSMYNGWYGSVTFKEAVKSKGEGGHSSYSAATSVSNGGRTSSMLVTLFGPNIGK